MDPAQVASSSPPPADVDVRSQAGLPTANNEGVPCQSSGSVNRRQLRVESDNLQLHQPGTHSMQLGFQDSNLSPALALLPDNARAQHDFTEYSLFQQSDTEFAPLRPYPDVSNASEGFTLPPQDLSINESLSQHPLDQETILSEEHAHSLCSQRKDQSRLEEKVQAPLRSTKVDADSSVTYQNKLVSDFFREADKNETLFLSKDVSAHQLLAILEKDLSLPSTTSSARSSGSESMASLTEEWKTNNIGKLGASRSMLTREGPSGKASTAQQPTQHTDRVQNYDPSAEVCNITTGSRNPQPDDSSEALHRELLSEAERHSTDGAEHRKQVPKPPTPADHFDTPYPGEHRSLVGVPYTGPNLSRVEQIQREHDLWSSGNQTGIDGSYLGFLPQSQSTPGVLKAPSKSSAKAKFGQLSDIESNAQSTNQSSPETPAQPADLVPDVHHTDSAHQQQEEPAAEVQSLPVLSYMQKVDAWKVNQSSGKPSLFDSLALQGFSGISPKKKAYAAISDSLNQILSRQAKCLQQPLVSSPTNKDLPQSSSKALSGSSSPRCNPSEKENTGLAAPESQSSLSTVVVSVHKNQQTDKHPKEQEVKTKDLMGFGYFSHVSPDPDRTFSGSQDSYIGVKNQTSIGASSVVSLEIDNYVPHWTSKLTPPPLDRPPELNIDERIPVYLHNLGIDQSPSTILTPFAPRGPIREPEFSPTDISTLAGSIVTPTESAQASQGNSPHKEDSVLSVNFNTSPPISVDSLGPAVSICTRRTSPPSKLPALESENEMPSYSQSEEDSQSSILNISQQLKKSDLDLLVPATKTQVEDHSEVHLNQSADEVGQDSVVGSKALTELRKLVMQADSLFLTGSSSAFSPPQRSHTEDGATVSVKNKSNMLQDSSSSTSLNPGSPSSLLWTSSRSDSMLTSDKQRQGSVGRESLNLNFSPTQAQVLVLTPASNQAPVDCGPTGTSLVLPKSVLRTEPEGCSAAPPDKAPNQTSLIQPPQQLSSPVSSADDMVEEVEVVDVVEEEEEEVEVEVEEIMTMTMPADPAQSVASSAAVQEVPDQEVMSECSSQSSLALRVAKLLQYESPATMMSSSTPSLTDNESKAPEGIKLKISVEQRRPLHLDKEDKRKIEEIKIELLLKNPLECLPSTDSESSSRVQSLHGPSSSAETYAANRPGNVFLSQPQQSPLVDLTEPSTQLQTDLVDIVCEIASREGVRIPTKTSRALTSITIATCRRSASPSPSVSPTALSLTPELLHLTELSSDQPMATHIQLQSKEERSTQTNGLFGPPLTTEDQNVTSLSAVEGLMRQETVGGQSAPSLQGSDGEDVQNKRAQASRNTEKTTQTHQSSSATTGHVSHVHLTLSPKHHQTLTSDLSRSPNVAALLPRRDFVPLRHSSSRGSSPDEGVGSSSPQEWSDAREPARLQASGRTAMFQSAAPLRTDTGTSTIPHRAETSLRVPVAATPVPLLLPYKPRGSEQLFYYPQTEADVSSTETTMESSHSGSDDAVPPRFSSDVLGHRDPGLDRGVTIRHTEGIYSKRLKTTTFKMQDPPSRDAAVAEDETSSTSTSSEIHQEAQRRDHGTSPVSEPDSQQSRLDLLWQNFCEQWTAEQSRPTSDRDVPLLERLERLSRLIDRSRAGRLFDMREDDGSQPPHSRTARNTEVQGNQGLKPRLHKKETPQSTSSSISPSTDTLSSMSTVDTARLIRVYGAHKVQRLRTSSSLTKLYSTINKQREEEENRSNDDIITIDPSESTNESAVVDSTSWTSTSAVPAHRGPSRTLTAKRAVKLANKSIQTGDLDIVSNTRHTRDVGTTFPLPATARESGQTSTPSSSESRGRGARRSPPKSQSVHRQRMKKRSPQGVSWFISADHVRSEARKENRGEEDEDPSTHPMNGAWFESHSAVGSCREPLRQKQIHQDSNEQHHTHHHHHQHQQQPEQRTKPVSNGLIPVSLQEALEKQRPDFILHSRQRMTRLALRVEERRQHMLFGREREEFLLHRMEGWERLPKPAGSDSLMRAVPWKEMIQRSKQIYENLPEVKRRKEEEKRRAEYRFNRLNAQLYNKRITNRVLGKRSAWNNQLYF